MAFAKVAVANTIRCPCCKCDNVVPKTRNEVALDLCKFGMDQAYKRLIFHGEELYDEPFDDNNGDIDIRSDQESEHIKELTDINPRNVAQRHQEQFSKWFESCISNLYNSQDEQVNDQILWLARGPDPRAQVYTKYCINGFLFRTKKAEKTLKTQNSGVVVKGDERTGYIDWFGVIKKIIALDYLGSKQIVLFKCDWFEVPPQGIQAEQVYYAKDVKNPNWCAMIRVKPRNLFAMPNKEQEVDDENNVFDNEPYQLNEIPISQHDVGGSEESFKDVIKWCRGDIEGLSIEVNVDEDRHLEDDYISNNNDTDLEEDLEEDEFFEHCLDDITDDDN
ncbi:Transposase-associated domain [Fagus crenata]